MSEVPKFENKDFRIAVKTGDEADMAAELNYTYKGELLFTDDTKKLFVVNENSGGDASPSTTTQVNFFEKTDSVVSLIDGADLELVTAGTFKAAGYISSDDSEGATETVTVVTDVRDNSGQMQKKTQSLTFKNGLLTAKGAESDWTDTTDA